MENFDIKLVGNAPIITTNESGTENFSVLVHGSLPPFVYTDAPSSPPAASSDIIFQPYIIHSFWF